MIDAFGNDRGFQIHPDGNVNGNWENNDGTYGCIGIQENAAALNKCRNTIADYLSNHGIINVVVNINFD